MNERQKLGRAGERFAAEVLTDNGYHILTTNYSCRYGEIDIVAEREDELFFIEVKTRRNNLFGNPGEAVTEQKRQHLRKAAAVYLSEHQRRWISYSFQVVEIGFHQIENAF